MTNKKWRKEVMGKLLEKKKKLKEGEIIELCFDQAFKIMYGNSKHIEILTMLLSKIFKVDYEVLEGKVEIMPLKEPSKKIGEKKVERDVVVSIKHNETYNIILEVNVKKRFYQAIIDRNLYYTFQTAGHTLIEKETYDKMPYTFLINFNTFFINRSKNNVFEEFVLQDKYGMVLSEKYKIFNINIEECYNLWYHNNYQGKFGAYEEDLVLLCASLMVKEEKDFKEILQMIQMKPEIKKLMEGVTRQMSHDEELVTEYKTWKNENERINASIINEERKEAHEEGYEEGLEKGIDTRNKEIVLEMYKNNISLEMIAKCTNLPIEEIEKIGYYSRIFFE